MGCVSSSLPKSPSFLSSRHPTLDDKVSLSRDCVHLHSPEPLTSVSMTEMSPGQCRFSGQVQVLDKFEPMLSPEGCLKIDPQKRAYYLDIPIYGYSWVLQLYLGHEMDLKGTSLSLDAVAVRNNVVYKGVASLQVQCMDSLRLVEDVEFSLWNQERKAIHVQGSLSWKLPEMDPFSDDNVSDDGDGAGVPVVYPASPASTVMVTASP